MWSLRFYAVLVTIDRGQAYSFAYLCRWLFAICAKLSVLQRVSLSFLRFLVAKKVYPIKNIVFSSWLKKHMVFMVEGASCRFLLLNQFLYLRQLNHLRISKIFIRQPPIFAYMVFGGMVFSG